MSNPSKDATQNDEAKTSFSDLVNKTVEKLKTDDKGNLVFPDDTSEEVKYAATLEKRRRDTQSSFTTAQQKTKALEAEKAALLKKLNGSVEVKLTQEQTEELEELKFSDPEAWRKKMNSLEAEARTQRTKEINDELKQVSTSSLESEELEARKQQLEEFNEAHPNFVLTDDFIADNIPPRITRKLETGKISFEQYLQECYDYTTTGKVVKQDDTMDQPNLSKVGGGSDPDNNAVTEDAILSYKKETY
jgi:hypothetical protein